MKSINGVAREVTSGRTHGSEDRILGHDDHRRGDVAVGPRLSDRQRAGGRRYQPPWLPAASQAGARRRQAGRGRRLALARAPFVEGVGLRGSELRVVDGVPRALAGRRRSHGVLSARATGPVGRLLSDQAGEPPSGPRRFKTLTTKRGSQYHAIHNNAIHANGREAVWLFRR